MKFLLIGIMLIGCSSVPIKVDRTDCFHMKKDKETVCVQRIVAEKKVCLLTDSESWVDKYGDSHIWTFIECED